MYKLFYIFLLLNTLIIAESTDKAHNSSNTPPLSQTLHTWELPKSLKQAFQYPKTFTAKIIGIRDGNTLHILHQKKSLTVKLAGIDAPERTQYFGSESQQQLSNRLFLKQVVIQPISLPFKNYAEVIVSDNKETINQWMVQNGLAWCSQTPSETCKHIEKTAKKLRYGLWQQDSPIEPWKYRESIKKNLANHTVIPVDVRKNPKYLSLLGQSQETLNYKQNDIHRKPEPFTPTFPKQPKRPKKQY